MKLWKRTQFKIQAVVNQCDAVEIQYVTIGNQFVAVGNQCVDVNDRQKTAQT
ncbi:MAG: hypothetical protein EZS28_042550, partial [Streblomastix strix]